MVKDSQVMKGNIKKLVRLLLLFVASIVVVNVLGPALQKKVGDEYKEQVSQAVYESDVVSSEKILCIDDNEEALLWRLRMIAAAKEFIVLATFDLRDDESGTAVMAALLDAADRGVTVRLVVDGIYQLAFLQDSDVFNALCAHENVDARYYNPVNLQNIYRVNYRMHDKYIMIDERMYLLGGRNISNTFLGEPKEGANVDRDILVYHTENGRGQSFQQLQNYFMQIWEEPCMEEIKGLKKQDIVEAEYASLRAKYAGLKAVYGEFGEYDGWLEDTFEADRITLLHNGTYAGNKEPQVLYALEQLAAKGEEVIIQTPYVICNREMYKTLEHIESGAEVKIFLNAVERGSNPWGCTDYLNNKEKILNTGADVYELMNEYAVHTKTVLIDDHLSVVGSFNLDMRSTYLDTELMLVIDSEYLNAHIKETIDIYREKSIEVLSDGTERKGISYNARELGTMKELVYQVLRVIIRPFRHML